MAVSEAQGVFLFMAIRKVKNESLCICIAPDSSLIYDEITGQYLTKEELVHLKNAVFDALLHIEATGVSVDLLNLDLKKKQKERFERLRITTVEPKVPSPISYVYIAKDTENGMYKVGCSRNIKARCKQLKTANAFIEIYYFVSGDTYLEQEIHNELQSKKIRGEWFDLSSLDLVRLTSKYNFKQYDNGKR